MNTVVPLLSQHDDKRPATVSVGALEDRSVPVMRIMFVDPSPISRACFAAAMSECPTIRVQGMDPTDSGHVNHADCVPDIIVHQFSGDELCEAQLPARLEYYQTYHSSAPILILANKLPSDMCLALLAQKVSGYLTSEHGVEAVIAALRLIEAGLTVFPRLNIQPILSQSTEVMRPPGASMWGSASGGGFTARQQQVFELILDGSSNRKIAERLEIAESTVKVHVRAIMQRSCASSRTQLVSQFHGIRR